MSNEKDKNAMAKSIGLMGPRSSTDITAARRYFWLARGIDFDKTFNAQTGYDVGVYTGEVSWRLPNSAEFGRVLRLSH